ncbi:MAG: lytic transglycosylase domain-containing protein [Sphingomonas sp.]
MTVRISLAVSLALASASPLAAAGGPAVDAKLAAAAIRSIPQQLDEAQRAGYRAVFKSIREGKWADARLQLSTMKPGPLHSVAMAKLLTEKGTPKATLEDLAKLLSDAPELPQAEQIAELAKRRGGSDLPSLPYAQALSWLGSAPVRARAKPTRSDLAAAALAEKMQPFIKDDLGADAQALLEATDSLSAEATTEWQQRVAWIYYTAGDDANARAMATKAAKGSGDWARQAMWVNGLAAWRQQDCAAADDAFAAVATSASDIEMRSAGLYWAARAAMACGRPERIETRLKQAAQYDETFYGLLARQALGIVPKAVRPTQQEVLADWEALSRRPNVRVAAALVEIDETDLADQVIKRQARIGDPKEYSSLVAITEALSLPATQIWLAHNGPSGFSPSVAARYPAPNWTPDGGWRVDKALVFAHTLQESSFRTNTVSAAGAYGLMQIRPGAAADIAKLRGTRSDRASLAVPSINIEIGQSYLEQLRDRAATGGLLPKVIAAYNAGLVPVDAWNTLVRDGGDPLLYIESIPYWETRGYVVTVLRNYWVYEREGGKETSPSRSALAQGLWPRFPGLPGAPAVKLSGTKPVLTASAN